MDFVDLGLSAVSHAAPWTLRWHYTEERLSKCIDVLVPGDGSGLQFQSYTDQASCWLTVTNRSPVAITIDRALVDVNLCGHGAVLNNFVPQTIQSASRQNLFVRGIFLSPSPVQLQAIKKQPQVWLSISLVLKSRIRDWVHRTSIDHVKNVELNFPPQ